MNYLELLYRNGHGSVGKGSRQWNENSHQRDNKAIRRFVSRGETLPSTKMNGCRLPRGEQGAKDRGLGDFDKSYCDPGQGLNVWPNTWKTKRKLTLPCLLQEPGKRRERKTDTRRSEQQTDAVEYPR